MTDPWFFLIVAAALMTTYFTACHFALLDFSRGRLVELLRARGKEDKVDHITELRDDWLFITAVLRTVANVAILWGAIAMLTPPGEVHTWGELALALLLAMALIVVFGVAIPISWSRYAAEPLLAFSLPALTLLNIIGRPIHLSLNWLDPLIRRLLGAPKPEASDHGPVEQEILDAISEGAKSGLVDEDQQDMIEAVVEFPTITVGQIMTPRTDIEALTAAATLDDVRSFFRQAGHSRVPVYTDDLDHIAGVLYLKDLVTYLGTNGDHPFAMADMMREAVFVPENKPLRDLLTEFKASKVHMAIVLDEYGGTAGLVTIEDILEEIVGEIHDEHEPENEPEPSVDRVQDNVYEADGRVYIDEVNDELELDLPDEEDYDTVGGFVFAKLGHIPSVGESFEFDRVRVTVIDAEKTRVNRVRLEILDRTEEPAGEHTD